MYESTINDPPNILIVEDEKGLADLYEHWLHENAEYSIEMAHDLETAHGYFHTPIDVIILDRNLPDGSGDELLATVRELGLDCSVVMVTGVDPTIDVLKLDFDDYLCKPVSEEELYSTVTQLIRQRDFKNAFTEFHRLKKKKALVESYCSPSDLATSEEYAAIQDQLAELRAALGEATNSHDELSFVTRVEGITSV